MYENNMSMNELKSRRDAAIERLHRISYTRNGTLVPKRAHYRARMLKLIEQARTWAYMARPLHGYPTPPRVQYPKGDTELERLREWCQILCSRNTAPEIIARVSKHIAYLEAKESAININGRFVLVDYVGGNHG